MRFFLRAMILVSLCAVSSTAWAQDTFSLQLFRPAVDSKGLVTVNASQTLSHLDYSLGFSGTYAYRTLSLVSDGVRFDVDHLVTMQLQGAVGLFGGPRWQRRLHGISFQLGLSLPVHILSGAREPGLVTADPSADRQPTFSAQSVGDLGVNLKVRFLNTSQHAVGLALLLAVDFPTGKSEQLLGEGQTTFRPQLIVDKEFGRERRLHLALNLGAMVRPTRHAFVDPGTGLGRALGTQLTYSLGLSYAVVPQRLAIVGEVYGGADLTGARGGQPLEAALAAKVYLATSSYFTIGAGASVLPPRFVGGEGNMTGAPLFRVFLGFTFEPVIGDRDHDGIRDDVDRCPDEPETYNGFQDDDGCPDELPPPPPPPPAPPPEPPRSRVLRKHDHIATFEKVYFKTGSAEILPRSFPLLDDMVTLLRDTPDLLLVEIAGHADERGDDDYNLRLTDARARSVRAYLVEHGIDGSRLSARGYGEREPALDEATQTPCLEHSERCWEKNRRVEFRILVQ